MLCASLFLLLKPLTISRTFGCDKYACYTLMRLGVMIGILGFVYLYPVSLCWQTSLSLINTISTTTTNSISGL